MILPLPALPRESHLVRVAALLVLVLCLLVPSVARAGAISVVSGTYGGNCGQATGNKTDALARTCNGRASCDYRVDHTVIGDPAPGCAKTYVAVWSCGGQTTQRVTLSAEAGFGSTARLTCPSDGAAPAPAPTTRRPAEVAGATLTASQLEQTMIWMAEERLIEVTPFCYRQSYDRGVGTAPSVCGPDRDARGAFCYDKCREGFQDNGTPTCLQKSCPSGYTDMGLMCHYDGEAMYSPVRWDGCASRAPGWLGGGCIGGLVEDDCRAGFHKTASMCYLDVPSGMSGSSLDPMKGSYTRAVNGTPSCPSDRVMQAGMCYAPPRPGYTCNVTNCNPPCASGTVECGPAACASSTEACARGITDMVVGPLQIVAFAATAGAAGPVMTAGKAAKALSAVKGVGSANDLLAAQGIFTDALMGAMDAAEGDLASISSEYTEEQVAAKYGRNSPNYRRIAREWVSVMVTILAVQSGIDVSLLAASMVDQTGVVGTISAYAKPPCQQHEAIP